MSQGESTPNSFGERSMSSRTKWRPPERLRKCSEQGAKASKNSSHLAEEIAGVVQNILSRVSAAAASSNLVRGRTTDGLAVVVDEVRTFAEERTWMARLNGSGGRML